MCSLKKCSKCKVEKEFSEFQKDQTKEDGYYSSCKACVSYSRTSYREGIKVGKLLAKIKYKQELLEMSTKFCCTCRKDKPKSEFHKRKSSADGVVASCKSCKKDYQKNWYLNNKEHHVIVQNVYKQNPEVKERRRLLGRTKYKSNKSYHSAMRRAALKNATPPWLTTEHRTEIKNFYRIAKHMSEFHEEQFEVDHVEPLIGKTSCGLMVPWNLRVIHFVENRSKGNKLLT